MNTQRAKRRVAHTLALWGINAVLTARRADYLSPDSRTIVLVHEELPEVVLVALRLECPRLLILTTSREAA